MRGVFIGFVIVLFCGHVVKAMHLPAAFAIDSLKKDSFARAYDSTVYHPSRQIKLKLGYGSDFAYRGLNEPKTPYLLPGVSYYARSGFFTSANMYSLLKSDSNRRLAQVDLSGGWDFYFGKNADASVSFTKSFFDRKNFILQTALSNTAEAYFGYDFDLIYTGLRFDYSFDKFQTTARRFVSGKKKGSTVILTTDTVFNVHDYFFTFEISHDFLWEDVFTKNDELLISPTYYIIGGSDNFSSALLKHSFPQYRVINDNTNKFHILYYTLSLPALYYIGNISISPSYEYNIARVLPAGVTDANYSLFRLTLGYRFKFKH